MYEIQTITMEPAVVKRMMKGYCEQLDIDKYCNLDEVDTFLE